MNWSVICVIVLPGLLQILTCVDASEDCLKLSNTNEEMSSFICNQPAGKKHRRIQEDASPANWKTTIKLNVYSRERILEVIFNFPAQSSANFTRFLIFLIRKGSGRAAGKASLTRNSPDQRFGKWNFSSVPSGIYKVRVLPMDSYSYKEGRCECWTSPQRICGLCIPTETKFLNLTFNTSNTTDALSISVEPPSTQKTSPAGLPTGDWILYGFVAVASALLVLLIAVAVLSVWKKGRCKHNRAMSTSSDGSTGVHAVFLDNKYPKKELSVPQIRRMTVLLLAAEDHKHFRQALEMFAEFLQVHCQCDVLFAPQQLRQLRQTCSSYSWLSGQIDSSDLVIIVSSEAASHLYSASRTGKAYKDADLGPEGDLFTPGIQHMCWKISSQERMGEVVVVRFDHTSPTWRLPIAALPLRQYNLPCHLTPFLHDIHGLDEANMDLSNVNLPLKGNVEELVGGREWLTAVQECLKYEQNNPDWFKLRFGTPLDVPTSPRHKTGSKQQQSCWETTHTAPLDSVTHLCPWTSVSSSALQTTHPHSADRYSEVTLEDFIAPETLSCRTLSCPSGFFDHPSEIDVGSSFSSRIRKLNDRYENYVVLRQYEEPETENVHYIY